MGATLDLDGDTVVAKVLRSGSPNGWSATRRRAGRWPKTVRSVGYRAAVAAPVMVGGRLWGVLVAATASEDALPEGLEQRLCDFAELVAQALANADAYEKLAASRARLVEVGDAERCGSSATCTTVHSSGSSRSRSGSASSARKLESDPEAAREVLATAQEDLTHGLAELRELARGIHPACSRSAGWARRSMPSLAAGADPGRDRRAARRAARRAGRGGGVLRRRRGDHERRQVRARVACDGRRPPLQRRTTVTVPDDGVGGADPAHGSGLRGLAARVEALNGRLDVDSPPERGTTVSAEIPSPD